MFALKIFGGTFDPVCGVRWGRNIKSRKKFSWLRAYNFLVCAPKFTNFFRPIKDELQLIKYFSDFRYVDLIRRYL